jgi:glucosamine-6-phosphate deaminase
MDEYIGLEKDAPQSFGYFLKESLFSKVPVGQVHYMDGSSGDPEAECARYAALLAQYPPDLVCLGIGENTHLAFNDPHVADFEDPLVVKIVDLAEDCRLQQICSRCRILMPLSRARSKQMRSITRLTVRYLKIIPPPFSEIILMRLSS